MILVRFILIGLIVYLIVRSFTRFGQGDGSTAKQSGPAKKDRQVTKKVSKEIGEYIDYEEVKTKNRQ
jgi:large-conductance mechanosensitive channel